MIKSKFLFKKMVDSVTEIPYIMYHMIYVTNIFVTDIRQRHRCIQINPSDLISVSSRRFINIP